jgi:EAL domain-containing protein (putative c-di-GMP-specific phosphodiesterase class I)/CheY-like chemotaxis protein
MSPVRILIAEDEPLVRNALADLLWDAEGYEVVGIAGDARHAIELARAHRPDVAIVDVKMPAGGGARAARGILRWSPGTRVLALSAYEDQATVLEMLRAGACGYLVKGTRPEDILSAVEGAFRGQGALSSQVTAGVISELAGKLEREKADQEQRRRRCRRIQAVLEGGGPSMVFQPIVHLDSDRVTGMEALARFDHPRRRDPAAWFHEADTVGMRTDLELAAARRALSQVSLLPPGAYLSVNLSPEVATSEGFAGLLEEAPAGRVVIEVTEHAPVEDYEELKRRLAALRDRGVRLAIDDAGAGFASLQHIVRLDPDFIKLDIGLTRGIDRDRRRRALAAALISFAAEIDATIVAEGVETDREHHQLRALGVPCAQGYFLAPPGPLPLPQSGVSASVAR